MTLPAIAKIPLNFYLGVLPFVIGLYISLWSVITQLIIGKGTPVPIMPTQKLVIVPPYNYSRNPMGFGYGIMLFGLGITLNSISYLLLGIILFALLLCYYKFVEEKELVIRFGDEYLEYKKRTPFLIPSFRRKK
jgi:protein-S-isoprenylcysteine O-methyltransferase Ste14